MRVALGGQFERFAYGAAATHQMIYRKPVRYEFRSLQTPVLPIVGGAHRTVVLWQYGESRTVSAMGHFRRLRRRLAPRNRVAF